MNDGKADFLRHTLSALAYRGGKALRGAPAGFAEFRTGQTTRTPAQILAHLGDLLDWGLSLAQGKEAWHDSPPLTWEQGTARFFAALEALDQRLASERHSLVPWKGCFRARSLIPSLTSARLPCRAAWPAARCGVKTTSGRKSR